MNVGDCFKSVVRKVPLVGSLAVALWHGLRGRTLRTQEYWETRYASEGTSGAGSYGRLGRYKADFLNGFVQTHSIQSVIEFGCGDGNQLQLAQYPTYVGTDISQTAIEGCRRLFVACDLTKRFIPSTEYAGTQPELALSLDVIYHLVEGEVFEEYMRTCSRPQKFSKSSTQAIRRSRISRIDRAHTSGIENSQPGLAERSPVGY